MLGRAAAAAGGLFTRTRAAAPDRLARAALECTQPRLLPLWGLLGWYLVVVISLFPGDYASVISNSAIIAAFVGTAINLSAYIDPGGRGPAAYVRECVRPHPISRDNRGHLTPHIHLPPTHHAHTYAAVATLTKGSP